MTITGPELLKMEQEALASKNARKWHDAALVLEKILKVQPDWEHGYGWFNLAECYEESGRISDARAAYDQAALVCPTDPILVGGRASFLYLHGRATEAFDSYIRLLALDRMHGDSAGAETTMTALTSLASRLGWSGDEVAIQIQSRLDECGTSTPDSPPS